MRINEEGLDIIKRCEGFYESPYLCPAGVPTIGYGTIRYPDGRKVSLEDAPITEETAEVYLLHEVSQAERAVRRLTSVPLTDGEFSALVSFIYNVGSGNFQRSTMRQKLNRGDYWGAANEFPKWRRGGGKILPGLVKRRRLERSLFLDG